MIFAKFRALCRKADRRTIKDAWKEVGSLLDRFGSDECAAYLRRREPLLHVKAKAA